MLGEPGTKHSREVQGGLQGELRCPMSVLGSFTAFGIISAQGERHLVPSPRLVCSHTQEVFNMRVQHQLHEELGAGAC